MESIKSKFEYWSKLNSEKELLISFVIPMSHFIFKIILLASTE